MLRSNSNRQHLELIPQDTGLLQMYNQNSLRPARLKQSIPRTMTVEPAKEVEPINPYGRVWWLMYSVNAPTVKMAMKITFPTLLAIRPPGFRTRNHMLKQNPPRKVAKPSVTSLNNSDKPPSSPPVQMTAATYRPCSPSDMGVCMTYKIRTVTARLTRYALEPEICIHFVLIPMRV